MAVARFGTVNALTPIEAAPPDLKDDMCGPHRKRHALEAAMADSADPDAGNSSDSAGAETNSQNPNLVTALRAPTPSKNLLSEPGRPRRSLSILDRRAPPSRSPRSPLCLISSPAKEG